MRKTHKHNMHTHTPIHKHTHTLTHIHTHTSTHTNTVYLSIKTYAHDEHGDDEERL